MITKKCGMMANNQYDKKESQKIYDSHVPEYVFIFILLHYCHP